MPTSTFVPLPSPETWPVLEKPQGSLASRPERFATLTGAEDIGPVGATRSSTFTPIRSFSEAALPDIDTEKDELVRSWLSAAKEKKLTPQFVGEMQADAERAGLSLDDILDQVEESEPFVSRQMGRLYRHGGPITRGALDSFASTGTAITNLPMRALSNIPGLEYLSEKADAKNRALSVQDALSAALDREGSMADYITPKGATILGEVGQMGTDIGSVLSGGAGAKAAGLTAAQSTKAMAAYYGLRQADQSLTVAKDAGLSPGMQVAHAMAMGGAETLGTMMFGRIAGRLGLATAEEAMAVAPAAASRLATRTGLKKAVAGAILEGTENDAIELAQMLWGSSVTGTDTMDNYMERLATGFVAGAGTRGAMEIAPHIGKLRDAIVRTQQEMPDTVKGTIEGRKAFEENREPKVPENASPAYKAAAKSEFDSLAEFKAAEKKALESIILDGRSLWDRLDAIKHAEAELDKVKNSTDEKDVAYKKLIEAALKSARGELENATAGKEQQIRDTVIEQLETASNLKQAAEKKDDLHAARNERNAEWRAYYGFSEMPEHEAIKRTATLERAYKQGLVKNASLIADDIEKTQRAFRSSEEQAAIQEAKRIRTPNLAAAEQRAKALPEGSDARREVEQQITAIRKDLDTLSLALHTGIIDTARTLGARASVDRLSPADVRVTAAKTKGADLTDDEANDLTGRAFDVQTAETTREHRFVSLNEALARAKNPQAKVIALDEFIKNQVARAIEIKGSQLTNEEALNVRDTAKIAYDTASNRNELEAKLDREALDHLIVKAYDARANLEEAVSRLEPMTFSGTLAGAIPNVQGLLKSFLTGGDLLPLMRQGVTQMPTMLKNLPVYKDSFSRKKAIVHQYNLSKRPNFKWYKKMGLHIVNHDTPGLERGDLAFSNAGERIPFLGPAQRAARMTINYTRADVADFYLKVMGGGAKLDDATLKAIGDWVNTLTGHGSLGKLSEYTGVLHNLLIGPHFMSSRLQYLTFIPLLRAAANGNKAAAKVIAKGYAKQVSGLLAMAYLSMSLGKMFWGDDAVDFGFDPTKPNAGRLRVGSQEIDITGSVMRPWRYLFSMTEQLRLGPRVGRDPGRVGKNIVTSNLAPIPSAVVKAHSYLVGGRKAITKEEFARDYAMPWSWNSIWEAFEAEGVNGKAATASILNLLGAGGYTNERNLPVR